MGNACEGVGSRLRGRGGREVRFSLLFFLEKVKEGESEWKGKGGVREGRMEMGGSDMHGGRSGGG